MTKCPEEGILQAYVDFELNIEMRKEIENHLLQCEECRQKYEVIKQRDNFLFGKMNLYKQFYEETVESISENKKNSNKLIKTVDRKGEKDMIKYKKIAAVACSAIMIAVCVTVQPVRAAISSVLSIFRVEEIQGINLSLKDMEGIRNKLQSRDGNIDVDKFGKIKTNGGKTREISQEEARTINDFKVKFPEGVSDANLKISTAEAMEMEFTLNVKNVNSAIKSIGGDKLLPQSIDGKTFKISFPRTINMQYNMADKGSLNVLQTKAPYIEVPQGVDVEEIYKSIVELPVLPSDLQRQLKSVKDWKNTVYLPVIENETEEIDVNGVKGYVYSGKGLKNSTILSNVVWLNNGVINSISGELSKDKVINLAKSMR